jgi:hypothetical protein
MTRSLWSWSAGATCGAARLRRPVFRPAIERLEERTMPDATTVPVLTEVEPNNQPFLAMPIPTSAVVLGSVSSPGDVDYYSFSITQPGALTVTVKPRNGSSLDAQLELDGVNSYLILNNERVGGGGQIAFSDNRAPGDPNPLIQQFLQSGPYQLAVSAAAGSPAGDYTLTLDFQPDSNPGADPASKSRPDVTFVPIPLPNGKVSLQPAASTGPNPVAIVAADFNGDGIPDLATANPDVSEVFVLLANGDGSFQQAVAYPLPDPPTSLIAVDFHNDGRMDLATVDPTGQWVTILPGLGDGTFSEQELLRVPVSDPRIAGNPALDSLLHAPPPLIATGDFNQDGTTDIAQLVPQLSVSGAPILPPVFAPAVLVNLNYPASQGSIDYPPVTDPLFGGPLDVTPLVSEVQIDPSFDPSVAPHLSTPLVGDLNGDGVPDVVIVSESGDILLRAGRANPAGTFDPPQLVNGPADPKARAALLLLNEPQPEIAALDLDQQTVSIYTLSAGNWVRQQVLSTPPFGVRLAAGDLDGSGRDALVVANTMLGTPAIYLARPDGTFGKPGATPDDPQQPDLVLDLNNTVSDVVLADVNGDGRPDLIATDPSTGDATVVLNEGLPPGQLGFGELHRFYAGPRLDASGNLVYGVFDSTADDITNADQDAGLAANGLTPAIVAGFLGLPLYNGELFPPLYFGFSNLQTSSAAVADFNGDGVPDVVVANPGADSFTILDGTGKGTFADPGPDQIFDAGSKPTSIVAVPMVDTNGDGKIDSKDLPEVAVLDSGTGEARVYLNDGKGGFHLSFSANVGTDAIGLSVADLNGDGIPDLLVGDTFGDVLVLLGNGDGTFQPPPSLTGDRVSLAVEDLRGNGQPDVLLANQKANTVMIQTRTVGPVFSPIGSPLSAGNPTTQLAPGAVVWFKLDNGSKLYDAVVMASGSNRLLVYRATGFGSSGAPTFAPPVSYATGTDPVNVTITDINGDGIPDMLVANQGSNDVTVLLGSFDSAGDWLGMPGPRLKSGGLGPISVNVINNPNSPGGLDLAVTNGRSGSVAVLPGRGQGFFDDRNPQLVSLGASLDQPPSVAANGAGVVVTQSGQLLGFNLHNLADGATLVSPAGQDVLAAEELNNGEVLAAEAGGKVAMLSPGPSGLELAGTLVPLNGVPLAASALDAIETPLGMQVLVTSAGQDTIFVFGLSPNVAEGFVPVPAPTPLPAPEPPSALVASSSSLAEAPLVLAVVLMTPSLTESNTGGVRAIANLRAGPAVADVNASGNVGGGEEDERLAEGEGGVGGPPGRGQPRRGPAWRPGLEKALERLDLFRPLENRPGGGLQSRLDVPWQETPTLLLGPDEDVVVSDGTDAHAAPTHQSAQSQRSGAGVLEEHAFVFNGARVHPSVRTDDADVQSRDNGASEGQIWKPVLQGMLAVLAAAGLGRRGEGEIGHYRRRPSMGRRLYGGR